MYAEYTQLQLPFLAIVPWYILYRVDQQDWRIYSKRYIPSLKQIDFHNPKTVCIRLGTEVEQDVSDMGWKWNSLYPTWDGSGTVCIRHGMKVEQSVSDMV